MATIIIAGFGLVALVGSFILANGGGHDGRADGYGKFSSHNRRSR